MGLFPLSLSATTPRGSYAWHYRELPSLIAVGGINRRMGMESLSMRFVTKCPLPWRHLHACASSKETDRAGDTKHNALSTLDVRENMFVYRRPFANAYQCLTNGEAEKGKHSLMHHTAS